MDKPTFLTQEFDVFEAVQHLQQPMRDSSAAVRAQVIFTIGQFARFALNYLQTKNEENQT